jgi:uncharacterized protein (DUF1778 family)
MHSIDEQPPKRQTLNIRIKSEERSLIDRAAHASGKTRTDFILDAARRAAEDTLLEQTLFWHVWTRLRILMNGCNRRCKQHLLGIRIDRFHTRAACCPPCRREFRLRRGTAE